jgi:hypothetical protein
MGRNRTRSSQLSRSCLPCRDDTDLRLASSQAPRTKARGAVLARWCLLLGGITYSSWALGFLVPTGLSQRAAYASELEAAGQPYGWLFRSSDVVSGLLLAAGALLALRGSARGNDRFAGNDGSAWAWPRILLAGVVVTGVTTAIAAPLTVDCTSSTGSCTVLRARGVPRSWHDVAHHALSNVAGWGFAATLVALLVLALRDVLILRGAGRRTERVPDRRLTRGVVVALVLLAAATSSPAGDLFWVASWRGVPQRINEAVESAVFVVLAWGVT